MQTGIRVRFAPSPTGHLHIGGLRSALFNWLFARHHQGMFLLRVEDTDFERSNHEYAQEQLRALAWCGITSDEPLVYQSQRLPLYATYAEKLVSAGAAYWFEDPTGERPGRVLKVRIPRDQETLSFVDRVHGTITVRTDELDDFIIVRSDGIPLYNFVVVVDDIEMGITHIIRGDDHVSNTHKQILMYKALGAPLPEFAHIPLIMGKDGRPLSKRDASTAVIDYHDLGFLPDALCNYLVRLGWSHGDQELFTRDEMIAAFSLAGVHPSSAMFDMDKLLWMNGVYMRQSTAEDLIQAYDAQCGASLASLFPVWSITQLHALVTLYKERARTLIELRDSLRALYDMHTHDELPDGVSWNSSTASLLRAAAAALAGLPKDDIQSIKEALKQVCDQHGVGFAQLGQPIRYALTGSLQAPSVYELIAHSGEERVLEKLCALAERLECVSV